MAALWGLKQLYGHSFDVIECRRKKYLKKKQQQHLRGILLGFVFSNGCFSRHASPETEIHLPCLLRLETQLLTTNIQ